ncbi:class I SAM-dependent methyltransferase [Candidatus Roizmanbacteria bacterium]|nr:class I SAM-dependent methyltransferase [Candidatus Roizmanbacteria bacterium]
MKPLCPLCNTNSKLKNTRDIYHYYLCSKCKTLFLHPKPSKKQLDDYYKKTFQYTAGCTNEQPIRERARTILKKLVKFNPEGLTILDIGSGYGYFLDEARKKGLKVTGIEPNRVLASDSINQLIESLHNVTFEQFFRNNKKRKYDFITLIHVIEHVPNPREVLQMTCKLLAPGGILYIETPNLDSHLYRAEKDNYTFLTPPDHLWIFSRDSLRKILPDKYNFKYISTYSYPEHLMGILKSLLKRVDNNAGVAVTAGQIQPTRLNLDRQDAPTSFKNRLSIIISFIKYLIFDKCIARLFYPLLNLKYYGSILELYIKKK